MAHLMWVSQTTLLTVYENRVKLSDELTDYYHDNFFSWHFYYKI